MMKDILILTAVLALLLSCKNDTKGYEEQQAVTKIRNINTTQNKAYQKMKTLCFSCHSPTAEMDMRMAPPMIAVKMHYTKAYDNQEDFVNAIWKFMQKPDEGKSLMKGAVDRFGLMPYMPYKEEDIKAIAAYMYNNELEKPDWFDEHRQQKHGKGKMGNKHGNGKGDGSGNGVGMQNRMGPKKQGKAIAMATKKELGQNLMKAISEKGTSEAVDFCNIKALPITAEKEKEFNATIKRASDKPRNPSNKANSREYEVISAFKETIVNGENPEAIVDNNGDQFDFYYPILTNDMCLQCHGEVGEQITNETYKTIKLKYPEDLAVGYDVNQVRGIWHIQFQK
jgi:cytochrome c553